MRDPRADNPYTHVAPTMHGDPVLDGVGGVQGPVYDADGKLVTDDAALRKQAMADAEDVAAKAREERGEDPVEPPPNEPDGELKTADDTTADDVTWDAPHVEPEPNHG